MTQDIEILLRFLLSSHRHWILLGIDCCQGDIPLHHGAPIVLAKHQVVLSSPNITGDLRPSHSFRNVKTIEMIFLKLWLQQVRGAAPLSGLEEGSSRGSTNWKQSMPHPTLKSHTQIRAMDATNYISHAYAETDAILLVSLRQRYTSGISFFPFISRFQYCHPHPT